jgi:3-oxoacyl-[acyl-carrier-protein] synthase II
VTLFDVSRQRAKTAAEVSLNGSLPETRLGARQASRLDRASKLLLFAADEAWRQSGWPPSEHLPVVLGTTSGGMSLGEAIIARPPRRRNQSPSSLARQPYQPQRQALDLAEAFSFQGPITIIANARASGANAIGHAWHLVRTGKAERFHGRPHAISHRCFRIDSP